jgi:hypothetical protein
MIRLIVKNKRLFKLYRGIHFMHPKMLIFDFGYTANYLAKKLAVLELHVVGTSRNQELFVKLIYPTYREGLQNLYDTGDY